MLLWNAMNAHAEEALYSQHLEEELKQIKAVLEWSSHSVMMCRFLRSGRGDEWYVDKGPGSPVFYHAPTLYQALQKAYESRDK